MQGLGCKDALNLDGGGSALLYANDKIINRPSGDSDGAHMGPRVIANAMLIRDRYKKKSD